MRNRRGDVLLLLCLLHTGACIVSPAAASESASAPGQVSITVLYDNIPFDPDLQTDWGYSVLVDMDTLRVLFDTGTSGDILLATMGRLDIDPASLDMIVISHAHYDHAGGLPLLLTRVREGIPVVLCPAFPADIAQHVQQAGCETVQVGADPVSLAPGLMSTGQMGDAISEQGLIVQSPDGWSLFTGCAHPGILSMVERAIEAVGTEGLLLVAGGFHLRDLSAGEASAIADRMVSLGVETIAPSHCTGDAARQALRDSYGAGFRSGGVGWSTRLEREMVD